jgi:RNA polymerase sigma-70 factor (ECF subfamily)
MSGSLSNVEVAEIYRRYGYLLLRRCRLLMRDAAAADDALQEAFVKVMLHGGSYAGADNKLRWLYRVVDNCCFDALKRRRDRPHAPEDLERAGEDAHPALVARMQAARALDRLSKRERRVAVLAFVDGLSQSQIASEVGWSRQTINKKLQAIRDRLARWLHAS